MSCDHVKDILDITGLERTYEDAYSAFDAQFLLDLRHPIDQLDGFLGAFFGTRAATGTFLRISC
jgi:hypothetical protein